MNSARVVSWKHGLHSSSAILQPSTWAFLGGNFISFYWKGTRKSGEIYLYGCLQCVSSWLKSVWLSRAANAGCCSNVTYCMNSWAEHFHFIWTIYPLRTITSRQKDHMGWGYPLVPAGNVGKLSYQEQSYQMSRINCNCLGKVLKRRELRLRKLKKKEKKRKKVRI